MAAAGRFALEQGCLVGVQLVVSPCTAVSTAGCCRPASSCLPWCLAGTDQHFAVPSGASCKPLLVHLCTPCRLQVAGQGPGTSPGCDRPPVLAEGLPPGGPPWVEGWQTPSHQPMLGGLRSSGPSAHLCCDIAPSSAHPAEPGLTPLIPCLPIALSQPCTSAAAGGGGSKAGPVCNLKRVEIAPAHSFSSISCRTGASNGRDWAPLACCARNYRSLSS
jgi:hypothetical protein